MNKKFIVFAALGALAAASSFATEDYRYHVPVTGIVSKETRRHPVAHVWLPEGLGADEKLAGVVLGMHNMLEEPVLANPCFRKEIARARMAIVWVTPMAVEGVDGTHLTEKEKLSFEKMFADIAAATGRQEFAAEAPVTVIGHSALGTFPFSFAAAFKERTRLAASLKGDWPEPNRFSFGIFKEVAANGTPMLTLNGEYEDGYRRKAVGESSLLAAVPGADYKAWIDVGGGHFDWSDELCVALARYITTPEERDAIIAAYEALPRGKGKFSVLGVKINGNRIVQNGGHLQLYFNLKGDEVEDGYEFTMEPFFENTVPGGSPRPSWWTGLGAGSPNPVPSAPDAASKIVIERISGPIEHIEGNRWRVKYCELYDTRSYRSGEGVYQIVYPGDDEFKRCVQQGQINVRRPPHD